MSYILDALKKSEEKRNALNLPPVSASYNRLQDVKNHRIQWAMIALLLATGSGWLLAQSFQPETIPTAVIQHVPTQPIVVATNETSSLSEIEPKKEVPAPEQAVKPVPTPPAELAEKPEASVHVQKAPVKLIETVHIKSAPAIAAAQQSDNPYPAAPEQALAPDSATEIQQSSIADKHIPNRSDLTLEKQNTLPAINIAGHIYDDRPAARMVVINGKVRREKQRFGDGLILEEITANGITLSHHGTIFTMGVFD